jgi:hypothetical protein
MVIPYPYVRIKARDATSEPHVEPITAIHIRPEARVPEGDKIMINRLRDASHLHVPAFPLA